MNRQVNTLLDELAQAFIEQVRQERGYVDEIAVDTEVDIANVEDEVKDRVRKLLT